MAERDLIGGISDGLVCRRTRATHGVRLAAPRQHRHERNFTRDVRSDDRRHDRTVDNRLDALDAALRGLIVVLAEEADFGDGTSIPSARLIDDAVRYVEHGPVHLVYETHAERGRLLRLAPHLVRPLEFTWPVYAGARIPRWKIGAGLMLYDALALFRNVGRHRRWSRDAVLRDEPMLRTEGLLGGARYFDATTNDSRLTLANA